MSTKFFKSIVLLLLIQLSVFGQSKSYKITVKLNNYKDKVAYLGNYYGDKKYIQDTCKLENVGDLIVFEGNRSLKQGVYLIITASMKYFDIIIGEDQTFSLETDTTDFIGHLKISGDKDNELFLDYQTFSQSKGIYLDKLSKDLRVAKNKKDSTIIYNEMKQTDSLVTAYRKTFLVKNPSHLLSKIFTAMPEPVVPKFPKLANGRPDSTAAYKYYKSHFFDGMDFSDERIVYTPIFHPKIDKFLNQLTYPMPDSLNLSCDYLVEKARANKEVFKWMVWYLTNTYEQSKIMGQEAVFVHMAQEYYCKGQAYWVDSVTKDKICKRADLMSRTILGAPFMNMILQDSAARSFNIYEQMTGDYSLIWFWNSNCGHCQKETPELYDACNKLGSDIKLNVFSITEERLTTKDDPQMLKWKKYLHDHDLSKWLNLRDMNNYYDFKNLFDVSTTPRMFIIDNRTKNIVATKLAPDQVVEVITKHHQMEKEKARKMNK
jgi:thiol-disulfide isomerase/thioredoxin